MKRCKTLLCLALALIMALSLCTVAMAEETSNLTEVVIPVTNYKYGEDILSHDDIERIGWKTSSVDGQVSVIAVDEVMLCDSAEAASATLDTYLKAGKAYYLKLTLRETAEFNHNYIFVAPSTETSEANPGTAFKFTVNGSTPEAVKSATVDANANKVAVVIKLPALEAENSTVEIPFTKTVVKNGSATPTAETFKFEWVKRPVISATISGGTNEKVEAPTFPNVTVTVDSIATNGEGNYDGKIHVTGPKYEVEVFLMQEGFFVKEVAGSADNWTYDSQLWYVVNENWRGNDGEYEYAFVKVDSTDYRCNGQNHDTSKHDTELTFTNTYTKNTVTPKPSKPAPAVVEAPKTFDGGVALCAALSVLSMTGAVVVGKKRDK